MQYGKFSHTDAEFADLNIVFRITRKTPEANRQKNPR